MQCTFSLCVCAAVLPCVRVVRSGLAVVLLACVRAAWCPSLAVVRIGRRVRGAVRECVAWLCARCNAMHLTCLRLLLLSCRACVLCGLMRLVRCWRASVPPGVRLR